MKTVFLTFLSLACLAGGQLANAGTHVWSGTQNGLWSNPANWSSGGVPLPNEAAPVIVDFPHTAGARRETTNDIANLHLNVLAMYGANYSLYSSDAYPILTVVGGAPPFPYPYNLVGGGTNDAIVMRLAFQNDVSIGVGADEDLTIGGPITGPGGFTKYHVGTLILKTDTENDYGGLTKVLDGTLELYSYSPGWFGGGYPLVAIPGKLVIGDTNMAHSPKVFTTIAGQFRDGIDLTINPNGTLELRAGVVSVGNLTMTGGTISLTEGWVSAWGGGGWVSGSVGIRSNIITHPNPWSTATISGADGWVQFLPPTNAPVSVIDVQGGDLSIAAKITKANLLIKKGPGALLLTGTNSYQGDTLVSEGAVIAGGDNPFGYSFSTTVTVSNGAQIVVNDAFTARNKLSLNGYGTNGTSGALVVQHDGAILYGTVTVESPSAVLVPNSLHTLSFGDGLAGVGELHKRGLGTLRVSGTTPYPMIGALLVDEGTLLLYNNSPAMSAVSGPLVIGENLANGTTAEVKLLNHNLISPGVPITINDSGTLNLFDYDQTVGPLTLQGGDIKTYNGVLTLSADVLATNGLGTIISGNVSLGSTKRAFHIAPGYNINIQAQVFDNGANVGFDKFGAGSLTLSGSNTFFGPANVLEGLLYARNDHALGNSGTGNTIIANGARLAIDGRNLGTEGIILSGDGGGYGALSCGNGVNVCNGVVNLYADTTINVAGGNDRLVLGGLVNGPGGVVKIGAGTLAYFGNSQNAYAGSTTVSEGGLELARTNSVAVPWGLFIGDNFSPPASAFVRVLRASQFGSYAPVTINTSGLLDLSAATSLPQTIGSLAGAGPLKLGLSTLTVGWNNLDTTYGGYITGLGSSSLIKVGTGKWTMNGSSDQFLGATKINMGTVDSHVWMPFTTVTVNAGANLLGDGTFGDVSSLGGTIHNDEFWVHPIELKNLTLESAATIRVDLMGPQATGLSRLSVLGAVNLGGAKLDVAVKFPSTVGTKFQIITNDGNDMVSGKFKDLDEGAKFVRGTNQFQITYIGGTGNDVLLTHIANVAAPHMGSIESLSNGQKKTTGTGFPGLTYTVDASTDLKTWIAIGTATAASPGGELIFIDPDAPNFTHRFYRFVAP
jgi:autotransporter-associated beta strand protein